LPRFEGKNLYKFTHFFLNCGISGVVLMAEKSVEQKNTVAEFQRKNYLGIILKKVIVRLQIVVIGPR
jgi:hypothetical protein